MPALRARPRVLRLNAKKGACDDEPQGAESVPCPLRRPAQRRRPLIADAAPADWDLIRTFLAVLETESLSAAARRLGASQPTVGRRISDLEQRLGRDLFTRSAQGLRPTAAALRLRPHAEAMAASAAALERTAQTEDDGEGGVVRLTASEVIGVEVLPEILADFKRRRPGAVIELVLSNRVEDVLRREVDMAVRMTTPVQAALLARKIGEVRLGLYAAARYLERRGLPQTVSELRAHDLIGYDRQRLGAIGGPPGATPDAFAFVPSDFSLRTDSDLAALAALRAGWGVGVMQAPLAALDPRLAPVLGEAVRFTLPIWLVMHEDLKRTPLARSLFDHLATGLLAYLKGGRGRTPAPPET